MKAVMDDGEEMDYGPGDVGVMAPDTMHGSSVTSLMWSSTGRGFADYAKR
jgi:hypothetical protein